MKKRRKKEGTTPATLTGTEVFGNRNFGYLGKTAVGARKGEKGGCGS